MSLARSTLSVLVILMMSGAPAHADTPCQYALEKSRKSVHLYLQGRESQGVQRTRLFRAANDANSAATFYPGNPSGTDIEADCDEETLFYKRFSDLLFTMYTVTSRDAQSSDLVLFVPLEQAIDHYPELSADRFRSLLEEDVARLRRLHVHAPSADLYAEVLDLLQRYGITY